MKFIAEFCQNHNGNFKILEKMIKSASKSGATYGKIQNIYAEDLTFRPEFETGIKINNKILAIKRPYKKEYKRLKKLEIKKNDIKNFIKICKDNNLIPLTTCFVQSHVDEIRDLGFKSIKVASYDCGSFPMIEKLKKNFNEIIVSTGASFDDEIEKTYNILKNKNFSFLHCITIYPTPLNNLNLKRMEFLKKFTNKVGFSDHTHVKTTGILGSMTACYLGAKLIERHFTILPENKTKDGPVSINEKQLSNLMTFSKLNKKEKKLILDSQFKNWKNLIGNKKRELSDEEILNRNYYRGRFASKRKYQKNRLQKVYNWEQI